MLNQVNLIGNVGQDPEAVIFENGNKLAKFSLATSETWKDKNTGEKKTATEWHNVVVNGPQADTIIKYVSKGSKLYVGGKLKTRAWEDKQGVKQYRTEVHARDFRFLDSKSDAPKVQAKPAPVDPSVAQADDDIPF